MAFYTLTYIVSKFQTPKSNQEMAVIARQCLWVIGILVIGAVRCYVLPQAQGEGHQHRHGTETNSNHNHIFQDHAH